MKMHAAFLNEVARKLGIHELIKACLLFFGENDFICGTLSFFDSKLNFNYNFQMLFK